MMLDQTRWYPIAASSDLPHGHIYQTRLGGQPLAVWRDSEGRVNIWEDRCPHRGVRFSVGTVVKDEVRCQYHAWRFASGSGACSFIPAQPDAPPPPAVRAKIWPVREADDLVWTGLAPEDDPPPLAAGTTLRPIAVNRDAGEVGAALDGIEGASLLLQPVDSGRCVIRGRAVEGDLATIDDALERLRRQLEAVPC